MEGDTLSSRLEPPQRREATRTYFDGPREPSVVRSALGTGATWRRAKSQMTLKRNWKSLAKGVAQCTVTRASYRLTVAGMLTQLFEEWPHGVEFRAEAAPIPGFQPRNSTVIVA